MKKRLFGLLTAAVLAAAAVPSFSVSAADYSYRKDGENNDFTEGWSMDFQGAEYDCEEQSDGSLRAEWNQIYDCLTQSGKYYETPVPVPEHLRISYDTEIEAEGIFNYGASCWFDLNGIYMEGDVIEGWNDWRPPGTEQLGSAEIDGVQYDLFVSYRLTAVPGNFEPVNMPQFWSVRHENTITAGVKTEYISAQGTVSLDQHIKAWSEYSDYLKQDNIKLKIVSAVVNAWGGFDEDNNRYEASGTCTIQKPVISTEAPAAEPAQKQPSEPESSKGLKDVFAPYFRLGSVFSQNSEAHQTVYRNEFSALTPSAAMFGITTVKGAEGKNVTMDFSSMDDLLSFAEENRIPVCGSAFLSSGLFMPEELFDCTPEEGNARIESMIQQTFAHIKDKYPNLELYAYNVCNQIDGADAYGWGSVFGDDTDYVVKAFKAARKYAPEGCKLYLSDGLKNADAFELAKTLMKENCIDGIALKASADSEFSADDLAQRIKKCTALGLDIQITDAAFRVPQDFEAEATGEIWKQFFTVALDNAEHISCVTVSRPFSDPYTMDELPGGFFRVLSNPNGTLKIEPFKSYYDVMDMMQEKQPAPVTGKTGDATCDGTVDVADAVLVLRYINEDKDAALTMQGRENGDVNHDGQTDADDASMILKFVAKKITF